MHTEPKQLPSDSKAHCTSSVLGRGMTLHFGFGNFSKIMQNIHVT